MKYKKENKYQVGIISYNVNTYGNNFGAALHSWALQKYLDKINISSVIIDYSNFKYRDKIKSYLTRINKTKMSALCQLVFAIIKRILFRRFFKKYAIITKNKYYKNELEHLNTIEQYCVDTDVTWTPSKTGFIKAFMCDYKNMKGKNNIAYSVDTGSREFLKKHQKDIIKYSKNFKYISLRNIFKLNHIKNIIGGGGMILL